MSSVYERKIKVRLKKSLIFNFLKFFYEQRPDGVQHRDDHYSNVREDRQPHVGKAQSPQARHSSLMPMAKTIFWYTIRRHFLEILIALEIFRGSSSIRTTSAASIAASDPMAPMADTDIRPAQNRRVIDPVAHKGQFRVFRFCFQKLFHFRHFVGRKNSLYTSSRPSSAAT